MSVSECRERKRTEVKTCISRELCVLLTIAPRFYTINFVSHAWLHVIRSQMMLRRPGQAGPTGLLQRTTIWHRWFDSASAVGIEHRSAAGHWRSSARSHHTGTETASLAACKATNRLKSRSTDLQASSRPHPAVYVGWLPTCHGGGTSTPPGSGRPHLHSVSDTDTARGTEDPRSPDLGYGIICGLNFDSET